MKISKISLLLALALGVGFASSCKEEEESVKLSFTGTLSFTLPTYARVGDVFYITPNVENISRSDGGDIGYFWRFSPGYIQNDTVKFEGSSKMDVWKFEVPDTLCTVTVTCTAYADGYYNSQGSQTITVVSDTKSISGVEYKEGQSSFVDLRDSKKYSFTTIGTTDWMSTNLAYEGVGNSFLNCSAVDNIFGKFYTYSEALDACPDGWTLPSEEDWKALAETLGSSIEEDLVIPGIAGSLMVDAYFNRAKLWDYWPQVKITNTSGLGVMPTGYCMPNSSSATFGGFGKYAAFWTATPFGEGNNAMYRYIYQDKPDVFASQGDRDGLSLSVRCIRKYL